MNKTQAIKHAKANVSGLYAFGDGWRFSVFSPGYNAWRETAPCEYWSAVAQRRTALINSAIEAMHPIDDDDCGQPMHGSDYFGGPWTSYVS